MSSLAGKFSTLRNNIGTFGLILTVREALAVILSPTYETNQFDRQFGTETSSLVSVRDGQLPADFRKDAQRYEPAVDSILRHIFRRLPIQPKDFIFIDVGCGKGRALLHASMYPFSKIRGVEISPVTSDVARRNVEIFSSTAANLQRCRDIEIDCQNVIDFEIPNKNIVFFLYNPFQGSIFESFMRRIYDCSQRAPDREILVVYHNPWSGEEWLQSSGCFKKIYENRVIMPRLAWNLWVPLRSM